MLTYCKELFEPALLLARVCHVWCAGWNNDALPIG